MISGEFDYYAPKTLDEAIGLLSKVEGAKVLAGGQSLIPAMRFRLASPSALIDISKIEGMEYVTESDNHLALGAMTRESTLEDNEMIKARYHLISDATHVIADPLVRNKGTVGGNIAHADPANDHPAVMLAYNAMVVAKGPDGERQIDIDHFFVDIFTSALMPNEILKEIRIPMPAGNSAGAYIKVERKVGDYATSAVAVQLTMNGEICEDIRIGLTNVSAIPMRAINAEKALKGQKITAESLEAAGQAAAAECDPSADLRGSAEYKRDLTRVILKRAVRKAVARTS